MIRPRRWKSEWISKEGSIRAESLKGEGIAIPEPASNCASANSLPGELLTEAEIAELHEDARRARQFALAAFKLDRDKP